MATGDLHIILLDYNNSTLNVLDTFEINPNTANGPELISGARFGYDVDSLGNDGDGTAKIAIGSPGALSANVFIMSVYAEGPFITTWEPNFAPTSGGTLGTVTIPVGNDMGTYTVDWGDGTTTMQSGDASHTYDSLGTYSVKISGDFTQIYMGDSSPFNSAQLRSIDQWGSIQWSSMERAFEGTEHMVYNATDAPDLTDVTDMSFMFFRAESFDGDLSSWDVSSVTDMSLTFSGAESFNQPLNNWDVSGVTNMHRMFAGAHHFNQPLNNWDVSGVTNMHRMFAGAHHFNQPLDQWDVSNVTDMSQMFADTRDFNQPLDSWDISSVTNMKDMFLNARSFDNAFPMLGTLIVSSYHDANSNGMQDQGELPFPGVWVLMYGSDFLDLVVTDQNGTASKEGIPLISFHALVIEQDGYRITTPFVQADGSLRYDGAFYAGDPMPSAIYTMSIGLVPVR